MKINVLVIEDNPGDANLIGSLLDDAEGWQGEHGRGSGGGVVVGRSRGIPFSGRLVRRVGSRLRCRLVDSIRHPAEVEALREAGQRFQLIWVDADDTGFGGLSG